MSESIEEFSIAAGGLEAVVISHGASLASLRAPDRQGRMGDVVLGLAAPADYLGDQPHFGATVGRFANRIAGARFLLGDASVRVDANEGRHCLHGGHRGLGRQSWRGEAFEDGDEKGVRFRLTSPHGEQGFPGCLDVTAVYRLRPEGELVLEHRARTDRKTVVNLTHHSYFHLGDGGRTRVFDHWLEVDADAVVEVDAEGIPTGRLAGVTGTAFDLRQPARIGDRVPALEAERGGFDHCYVLRPGGWGARVREPESGRTLEIETTQPGLQVYTGNFLDGGLVGPAGIAYGRWHALCLEPQGFPDAPNHPGFPSALLEPGEEYAHTTLLRFGVEA